MRKRSKEDRMRRGICRRRRRERWAVNHKDHRIDRNRMPNKLNNLRQREVRVVTLSNPI